MVKFQRAQTRGIQSLGRVGSPSAYAVNSVTLRALFFFFTFYLVHTYACTCAICEGLRKITGLCFSPVPCGSRESKLRSSGLAASAESPLALGGFFQAKSPGGGSFSTGVSAYEVQGALQTAPGLLRPKASAQQLPWKQTEQTSARNSRSWNLKHLGSNDLSVLPQHPVVFPPGSLPVPPIEGSRHRLRSPYATNFRIDPPIARLWRRRNGKTVSTADGSL